MKNCRNYFCLYADFCPERLFRFEHVMHTNDGRTIVSDGKPQTDSDTGKDFV